MSDDRASKFLIGAFAASMANKKLKEQHEATERLAEAQEEANRIASRQEKSNRIASRQQEYQPAAVTVLNGYHRYTYADGAKYVGEFKDDKQHGQGTYTSPDGRTYVGEWKEGTPNGQGTFTYANGDKYVGEWKNDQRHGQGTYTYPDGSVKAGIWKNGVFTGMKSDKIKDQNKSKTKKHTKSDKEALTIEDELLKIKELYEKDLITEEVYKARQISILESYK